MYNYAMSNIKAIGTREAALIKQFPAKETTLEALIERLDQRGILVLSILLGQQAMKLLTEETAKKELSKSKIIKGEAMIKVDT
jgi:hypothetical protein